MKKLNIITMAALVLSFGAVAQAQSVARVTMHTQEKAAVREGGSMEVAGDVFLEATSANALNQSITSIKLTYSAPLAMMGTPAEVVVPSAPTGLSNIAGENNDDGEGVLTADWTATAEDTVVAIQDVTLNVSKASGPVSVTIEYTTAEDGLVIDGGPTTMPVITAILPGVKATAKMGTARTRGTPTGGVTATFTIEEGFKGAFMVGQMVEFEVTGLPEAATIGIVASDANPPATDADPPVPTPRPVDPETGTLTGDADGDEKTITLTLGDPDAAAEEARGPLPKITLLLRLDAEAGTDDLTLPLMMGDITARVTLAGSNFEDAKTAAATIFAIRPAQCTMLFPLVTYIQGDGEVPLFNTGFAITNPAYVMDPASGHITFTFYKNGIEPAAYTTHGGSPGTGLGDDGRLEPGGTYTVNANELLEAANWAELGAGHVHVRTDYTDCNGVGLIYGTMGIDQSYTAIIIDSDTGM